VARTWTSASTTPASASAASAVATDKYACADESVNALDTWAGSRPARFRYRVPKVAIPHCDVLVAQLRAAYGRHVGDPAWTHFIRRLEALSPAFAAAWAAHDVSRPTRYTKKFRHPGVGPITTTTTSFAVNAVPGAAWSSTLPTTSRAGRRSPGWPRATSWPPATPAGPSIIPNGPG
jgi:MmyB-like transcription regulator ligand binding domain